MMILLVGEYVLMCWRYSITVGMGSYISEVDQRRKRANELIATFLILYLYLLKKAHSNYRIHSHISRS